jgi:hypothetical protein
MSCCQMPVPGAMRPGKLLAHNIDPNAQRKAVKSATAERAANSFEMIAREWLATKTAKSLPATVLRTTQRLENDLFPYIGNKPIAEIEAPELLEALNKTVERGALHTAKHNPAVDLVGALPSDKIKHHSTHLSSQKK